MLPGPTPVPVVTPEQGVQAYVHVVSEDLQGGDLTASGQPVLHQSQHRSASWCSKGNFYIPGCTYCSLSCQ